MASYYPARNPHLREINITMMHWVIVTNICKPWRRAKKRGKGSNKCLLRRHEDRSFHGARVEETKGVKGKREGERDVELCPKETQVQQKATPTTTKSFK